MSYTNLSGFQVVAFKSEREGALKDLSDARPLLSAFTKDNSTFIFKITQVTGTKLYLTSIEHTREAVTGEQINFIFSLSTGQYAIVGSLELAAGANSVVIDLAKCDLMRLQRRDSFRISVPPSISLTFYLHSKIR